MCAAIVVSFLVFLVLHAKGKRGVTALGLTLCTTNYDRQKRSPRALLRHEEAEAWNTAFIYLFSVGVSAVYFLRFNLSSSTALPCGKIFIRVQLLATGGGAREMSTPSDNEESINPCRTWPKRKYQDYNIILQRIDSLTAL